MPDYIFHSDVPLHSFKGASTVVTADSEEKAREVAKDRFLTMYGKDVEFKFVGLNSSKKPAFLTPEEMLQEISDVLKK